MISQSSTFSGGSFARTRWSSGKLLIIVHLGCTSGAGNHGFSSWPKLTWKHKNAADQNHAVRPRSFHKYDILTSPCHVIQTNINWKSFKKTSSFQTDNCALYKALLHAVESKIPFTFWKLKSINWIQSHVETYLEGQIFRIDMWE